MPEPVHEGNLDNNAREARIREQQCVDVGDPCLCSLCFLLRRLDEARAELKRWAPQPHYCKHCGLRVIHASEHLVSGPRWTCNPNTPRDPSVPVRSAPASRTREERVRVEVRPVIDATPRTPPLGHWWTCEQPAERDLDGFLTVSPRCVVPGCGLGPEAHE